MTVMYNPFPLLNEPMLREKLQAGKRWFVRQTYKRGMHARLKAAFLFRGYDADEQELAERHIATLQTDPNAFLYDAENPIDLQKLFTAASQPFGFKVFYAGKKGVDWKPPADYQARMKKYIKAKHPGWQSIRKGDSKSRDKIAIGLYEEFGQLFLKFSFEDQVDQVPLQVIENFCYVP
jgi:hypothetical protein